MSVNKRIQAPPYSQVPNVYLDNQQDLSLPEVKLMNTLCRMTFGWGKSAASLSIAKLVELTGLSRSSVFAGLESLTKRNWVRRIQNGQSFDYGIDVEEIGLPVQTADQSEEYTGPNGGPVVVQTADQLVVQTADPHIKKELKERKERESAIAPVAISQTQIAQMMIDHLNAETGRTGTEVFRITQERIKTINARLKEIAGDAEGMKVALSRKVREWKGNPEMAQYIHPDTLFRPAKFMKYYESRNLPIPKPNEPKMTPWQEQKFLEARIATHPGNREWIGYEQSKVTDEIRANYRTLQTRLSELSNASHD